MHAYLRFLYNFFVFGATFAGCSSLQGSIYNPVNSLTSNGFFYILGICIYAAIICEAAYKLYIDRITYFWRLRVILKATVLSLAHFSPIYLFCTAILLDLMLLTVEYRLCRYPKYFGRWWMFAHIATNLSMIMLVFLPVIQLSLLLVSLFLVFVVISEVVMHYREIRSHRRDLRMPEYSNRIGDSQSDTLANETLYIK